MASEKQNELIAALDANKIESEWNGRRLDCKVAIKSGSKTKWQRFSFTFDDPEDIEGAAVCQGMKGAYVEHFATQVLGIIILVGQGQNEADKFAAECVAAN